MTLPLSAADVLAEHVVFELDCIDRMYCNAYVRKLTYPGGRVVLYPPPGGDVRLDGSGGSDQQAVCRLHPPVRR